MSASQDDYYKKSFSATTMAIIVLVPTALWTLKLCYELQTHVPQKSLKIPVMLIFLTPVILQFGNLIGLYLADLEIEQLK